MPHAEISELRGKTLTAVTLTAGGGLRMQTACGRTYSLGHARDCCEIVELVDVCGDLADLQGSPILQAECVTNKDLPPPRDCVDKLWQWTFYKLATCKGSVTLRWFGSSNRYYSVDVDCHVEEPNGDR